MNNQASAALQEYLSELKAQLATGEAREHAYRPALKRLMEAFDDLTAVNDPRRSEHGNPDFVFLQKSNPKIIKGYAEAKDIDKDLHIEEQSEQMARYSGYANLILTNYLDFRFFKNGEKYKTITLGHLVVDTILLDSEAEEALLRELDAFLSLLPERIGSGKRLAQIMGAKARRVRDDVMEFLNDKPADEELEKIFTMMRELLVPGLDHAKFADMYAQTLVYGLFVARYSDLTADTFSRQEARDLVPKTNPFLRSFFDHIAGPSFDQRLGYIVDELCDVFRVSDVQDIVSKHLKIAEVSSAAKDPIIHFYEDFLGAYDKDVKRAMGAFYTPVPVVRFIVANVDRVLREQFSIADGLASSETISFSPLAPTHSLTDTAAVEAAASSESIELPRVQILDPAAGTATFLNETIKFIHAQFAGQEGRWPKYVEDHLLDRLYGFEIMMAPYTVAHLKLGMTLAETGARASTNRLNVFLTNTLQEGKVTQPGLFSFGLSDAVTEESRLASEVKDNKPIMVVMGNPPYSAASSNRTPFANRLVDKYKVEPGGFVKLNEQKTWLNDDYVKFMAFAEEMIHRNGGGVMAMITNNGYLDNPTFRGMRWHLTKTFDKIYVLDLHGNANKHETAPDGTKDENVFEIRQGVGIILALKNPDGHVDEAEVFHAELFGKRTHKFDELVQDQIAWKHLTLDKKFFYFVPTTTIGKAAYESGVKVDELFNLGVTGIVTRGDDFIVSTDRSKIEERVKTLAKGGYSAQDFIAKFGVGKGYAPFVLGHKRAVIYDAAKIVKLGYRPFDVRYTYFDNKVLWRWREEVMKNFLTAGNVGLVTTRLQKEHPGAFVTETMIGHKAFNSYDSNSVFPLWVADVHGTRVPNFEATQLALLLTNVRSTRTPIQIFDYIYGALHSESFLITNAEFLRSDFPRIPVPDSAAEFDRVGKLGTKLRQLHLMHPKAVPQVRTTFPISGDDVVRFGEYRDGNVYINSQQYFGNVSPLAWNMFVGGYRPAFQWLKDRIGVSLSDTELTYYQRVISALEESASVAAKIDVPK